MSYTHKFNRGAMGVQSRLIRNTISCLSEFTKFGLIKKLVKINKR